MNGEDWKECPLHERPRIDCPWEMTFRGVNVKDSRYMDCQYVCAECGRVQFKTEER